MRNSGGDVQCFWHRRGELPVPEFPIPHTAPLAANGTAAVEFAYPSPEAPPSLGGTNAGRYARRAAATTKGPRLRAYGNHHPRPGHRSHHRHLHPGASGYAEVSAGGQARGVMADRRQDSLLQLGWLCTGRRREFLLILL